MNLQPRLRSPGAVVSAAGSIAAVGLLIGFYSVVSQQVERAELKRTRLAAAAMCAAERPAARELCLLTATSEPARRQAPPAVDQRWHGAAFAGAAN